MVIVFKKALDLFLSVFIREIRGKKKGNYIQVDTTTKNNKDYLNQQHQQLVSTTCAAINSLPRSRNLM